MRRENWRSRRRRDLTPEERLLWEKIAETVRPLTGRKLPAPPEGEPQVQESINEARPLSMAAPRRKPSPTSKSPPLASIEPKLAKDLRRGGAVDARLDLHGLRQAEAHHRLIGFLIAQQASGARVVLVITGKGRPDMGGGIFEERGVLRRLAPVWLSEPSLRGVVLGFSEAAAAHGGSGALYVRLRRLR